MTAALQSATTKQPFFLLGAPIGAAVGRLPVCVDTSAAIANTRASKSKAITYLWQTDKAQPPFRNPDGQFDVFVGGWAGGKCAYQSVWILMEQLKLSYSLSEIDSSKAEGRFIPLRNS